MSPTRLCHDRNTNVMAVSGPPQPGFSVAKKNCLVVDAYMPMMGGEPWWFPGSVLGGGAAGQRRGHKAATATVPATPLQCTGGGRSGSRWGCGGGGGRHGAGLVGGTSKGMGTVRVRRCGLDAGTPNNSVADATQTETLDDLATQTSSLTTHEERRCAGIRGKNANKCTLSTPHMPFRQYVISEVKEPAPVVQRT